MAPFMDSKTAKPKVRKWVRPLVAGAVLLLIAAWLAMKGIRPSQVREAQKWEEHVADLEREWKTTAASANHSQGPQVDLEGGGADRSIGSKPSFQVDQNDPRIAEAIALIKEMYALYVREIGTWHSDAARGMEQIGSASAENSPIIEKAISANRPNLEKIERVKGLRVVWPTVDAWASTDPEISKGWPGFQEYLIDLALVGLRPTLQSRTTKALARGIVDLLPFAEMLTAGAALATNSDDVDFSELIKAHPAMLTMRHYIANTLIRGNLRYRPSDWEGLDWSLLTKRAQPPDQNRLALLYDRRVAEWQSYYLEKRGTLPKRFNALVEDLAVYPDAGFRIASFYEFFVSGAIYRDSMELRKAGFQAIAEGRPRADLVSIERSVTARSKLLGLLYLRKGFVSGGLSPTRFLDFGGFHDMVQFWIADLALHLVREDSPDSLCSDQSMPYLPFLMGLGYQIRLTRLDGRAADYFTLSINGPPGELGLASLRGAQPLYQLSPGEELDLNKHCQKAAATP